MPDFFHGSVKERSAFTNASCHVGQDLLVSLDLESCFPSITNQMAFHALGDNLILSPTVAHLLTKLTTFEGHIPHGSPTSSMIANLVIAPVVEEIRASIEEMHRGIKNQTQYVDDTTLSGFSNAPDELINQICRQFSRYGLRISRDKIKVARSNKPQIVTGHLVNKRVAIPREERARIRAAIHELSKTDADYPNYKRLYNSAVGRVRRLAKFHPNQGGKLLEKLKCLPIPQ